MDTIQPLYSVTETALPVLQSLILNPHKHRQNKSPGPENTGRAFHPYLIPNQNMCLLLTK